MNEFGTDADLTGGHIILDSGASYVTATARLPEIGGGYTDPQHIAYSVIHDAVMPIDIIYTGRGWHPTFDRYGGGYRARVRVTFHNSDSIETLRGFWFTAPPASYIDHTLCGRIARDSDGPYLR